MKATGVVAVCFALSAVTVGGAIQGPAPASAPAQSLPTVADAPPGTVFETLYPTSGGGRRPVGLVKRGESGGLLFNPATGTVTLDRGDSLVARNGQFYRVTVPQEVPGSGGTVGPNGTLFQGERDHRAVGFTSTVLEGTGETEGVTLDLAAPVPATQPPGVYRDPAAPNRSLRVAEPRITNVQLVSQAGRAVVPGGTVKSDEFVILRADVNFLAAERAQVKVVAAATGRTVRVGSLGRSEAVVRFAQRAPLVRNAVPPGRAKPEGPNGSVRSLANPRLRPESTVHLVQDLRPIRRPGRYEFVVAGDGSEGYGDLFRAGVSESVTVRVSPSALTESVPLEGGPLVPPPARPELHSPRGSYVLGETVDVAGTAPVGRSAVAVYVRRATDGTRWELVAPRFAWVFVRADGTWSVPDVDLSANFVVDGPGRYELGVIPVGGADKNGDSFGDRTLSTGGFIRGGGVASQLRVTDGTTPTDTPRPTPATVTRTVTTAEPTTAITAPRPTPSRTRPDERRSPPATTGSTGTASTTGTTPATGPGFGVVGLVVAALLLVFRAVHQSRGRG